MPTLTQTPAPADTLILYGDPYGRALALVLDDAIRARWPAGQPSRVGPWSAPAELGLLLDLRRRAIERAQPDPLGARRH